MRPQKIAIAFVSIAALASLAPAASAGSATDPEIADECDDGYLGGPGIPSLVPPAEVNLLSAWFEEIWEPGEAGGEQVLSALKVTLRACADLDLVPPAGQQPEIVYSFSWDNGACRQSVRLIRTG